MMKDDLEQLSNIGVFGYGYDGDDTIYEVTRKLEEAVEGSLREKVSNDKSNNIS